MEAHVLGLQPPGFVRALQKLRKKGSCVQGRSQSNFSTSMKVLGDVGDAYKM